MALADDLAPYVSFFNLLGFAAAIWLLVRARKVGASSLLGPFAWIMLVGTGLHMLNDYVAPILGFDAFSDDAYDHLFIHIIILAALVTLALAVDREAKAS